MQILVLGMHRSGTSMVAGALARMGAATGPSGLDLGANEENPRGFFERRDVVDLDRDILAATGADWHRPGRFELDAIPAEARRALVERAAAIAAALDASRRPWVIKDPRLSLTLPIWREALDAPLAVLVHRHPVEVAESLRVRNDFPSAFGIALWERYSLAALEHTTGLPRVLVHYNEWVERPRESLGRLGEALASRGVTGLALPAQQEDAEVFDPALHRNRAAATSLGEILNARQVALARALEDASALDAPVPRLSEGGRLALEQYEAELDDVTRAALDARAAAAQDDPSRGPADGTGSDEARALGLRSGMSSRYGRLEIEFRRLFDARESTKRRLERAEGAYRRARERITRLESANGGLRDRLGRAEEAYRRARTKRDDALAAYDKAKRRAEAAARRPPEPDPES